MIEVKIVSGGQFIAQEKFDAAPRVGEMIYFADKGKFEVVGVGHSGGEGHPFSLIVEVTERTGAAPYDLKGWL